jgi:hypothetical protein
MNIFYICCYTGAYKENVFKVLENLSKYPNFHIYLINQTNLTLDIFYTNYNEILVSKIGVSSARNIGIDLALKKSNSISDLIYFWDEDIYISDEILYSLSIYELNLKYNAITFKLKSFNGGKIGNNLISSRMFSIFNSYRLGNPSFFFRLNNIKLKFNEKIGPGKKIIIAAEDTLFILQNKFFKTFCPFKNLYLLHPNAYEISNNDKIYNYSISQGYILKKLNTKDKIIFFLIIIHRPFFGYLFSVQNKKLYKNRLKGILNGYKKDFNI